MGAVLVAIGAVLLHFSVVPSRFWTTVAHNFLLSIVVALRCASNVVLCLPVAPVAPVAPVLCSLCLTGVLVEILVVGHQDQCDSCFPSLLRVPILWTVDLEQTRFPLTWLLNPSVFEVVSHP